MVGWADELAEVQLGLGIVLNPMYPRETLQLIPTRTGSAVVPSRQRSHHHKRG